MRFDGHVKITLQALDILTSFSRRQDVSWPVPKAKIEGASRKMPFCVTRCGAPAR